VKIIYETSLQSRQSQSHDEFEGAFCLRRLETKMLQVVYTWQLMPEIFKFQHREAVRLGILLPV